MTKSNDRENQPPTLREAFDDGPAYQEFLRQYPELQELTDRLEGAPRIEEEEDPHLTLTQRVFGYSPLPSRKTYGPTVITDIPERAAKLFGCRVVPDEGLPEGEGYLIAHDPADPDTEPQVVRMSIWAIQGRFLIGGHHHRCNSLVDHVLRCSCERERAWDQSTQGGQ